MADQTARLAIDIEADATKAERTLDDVAGQVEQLDRTDVTVDVTADTTQAERAVEDLAAEVRDVPKVVLEVDDDAVSRARRKVDTVGDAGSGAGKRFGAQFARDSGAVLNEQAAMIGGDFTDGLATAFEAFGVSESLAGPLTAALGIGTVVVAAGTMLWQALTKDAEAYRKKVEEVGKAHESLAKGDVERTAKIILQQYGKVIDGARKYGFTTGQVVAQIVGGNDQVITGLEAQKRKLDETAAGYTPIGIASRNALQAQIDKLREARKAWQESGQQLQQTEQDLNDVKDAVLAIPTSRTVAVNVDFRVTGDRRAVRAAVYDPDNPLGQATATGGVTTTQARAAATRYAKFGP